MLSASGVGTWTIDSMPVGAVGASITIGTDTIFNAEALTVTPGVYKLMFTNVDGPNICKDSIYVTVNGLPNVDLGDDRSICPGAPSEIFDAGAFDTYSWYVDAAGNTQEFSSNEEGEYAVAVTDANGCTDSDTVVLSHFALPVVDLGADRTICPGAPTEVFDAGAFDTYSWYIDAVGNTQEFSSNEEGEYAVAVTDANGCADSDTVILSHFVLPVVDLGADRTICPGSPLEIFDAGAFDAYSWYVDATGNTQEFSSNEEGEYAVAVTDANGCTDSDTVVLFHFAVPVVDLGEDRSICPGSPVEVFDAGAFDTYSWYVDAAGNTQEFSSNEEGEYAVAVTDANGCTDSDTVVLSHFALPVVDLGADRTICPGAPTEVFDAGAFDTYSWYIDAVGNTQEFSSNEEGEYAVAVTDANGCANSDTVVLSHFVVPVVDLGEDRTICPGAPAEVFDAGAFETYNWYIDAAGNTQEFSSNEEGEYAVAVTSANGCADSDTVFLSIFAKPIIDLGQDRTICEGAPAEVFDAGIFDSYKWEEDAYGNNQQFTSNQEGTFTVIVEDLNGCSDSDTVILNVIPLPTPDVISDVAICPGMNQGFDVSMYDNGYGPYTYAWSDGSNGSSINVNAAGVYWVDITDVYGCTGRDEAELTIENDLTVNIFSAPEIQLCAGEDTILRTNYNAADGYNFTWTGLVNSNDETIITIQNSGIYEVKVDNGLGCEGDAVIEVIINPLPEPDPQDAEFCEGESVNVGLGMGASYNYSWDNGEATEFIEVNSNNISSPYEVTVINALTGCEAKAVINVTERMNPIVILDDVAVCEGIPVELRSANNYVNANYSWVGGANTEAINPVNGGNYTLTVTDEFGCEGSDDATVTFFPIPEVDLGEDTVTICEGEEHIFDAGNDGKAIQWNNGEITSKVKGVETYKYVVSVEEDGCTAKDSAQLTVVPLPESQIDKSLANEKVCFEELDRGIEVVANNSDAYEYLWSDNSNGKSVTVTEPGTYTVKILAGNCAVTDYIVFEEFCPWALFVPNAFTPDGDGLNDSFNAEVYNVIDYQMLIYNRWGQLIYESNSIENDWDGTFNGNPVQIDVYVYKIYFSYQQENGGVMRSQKVGRVTVLR